MSEQTRTTVYLKDEDRARLERIKAQYGLGVSAAMRAGIALLERNLEEDSMSTMENLARARVAETAELAPFAHIIFTDWPNWDEHLEWVVSAPTEEILDWAETVARDRDPILDTEDRVEQVNWLREFAGNIAQNLAWGPETSAEELVDSLTLPEVRESWGIIMPTWFDDHDRSLLIQYVTELLD